MAWLYQVYGAMVNFTENLLRKIINKKYFVANFNFSTSFCEFVVTITQILNSYKQVLILMA